MTTHFFVSYFVPISSAHFLNFCAHVELVGDLVFCRYKSFPLFQETLKTFPPSSYFIVPTTLSFLEQSTLTSTALTSLYIFQGQNCLHSPMQTQVLVDLESLPINKGCFRPNTEDICLPRQDFIALLYTYYNLTAWLMPPRQQYVYVCEKLTPKLL